jgi:DNA-binding CsgD family transcriptional regulator
VTLTPREGEVLHQLSLGGSYGDIARALYVTENTVKTHLTSIYRKFGVDRRAEALQVARELGLVATPDPEPTRRGASGSAPVTTDAAEAEVAR